MEYHVTREGKTLGKFEEESVKDGLSSGFLRPSDHFFHEGMDDWELLGSRFPIKASTDLSAKADDGPVGVRGWLLVICILLISEGLNPMMFRETNTEDVLENVEISKSEFEDYRSNPDNWESNELLDAYDFFLIYEDFVVMPLAYLSAILGILILIRVPKIKIVTLIFLIVSWLVDTFWCFADFNYYQYIGDYVLIINYLLWVFLTSYHLVFFLYFLKSKRVKNTLT